jgi:quercetin dioxygenase-like cupin family protein
MVRKACVSFAVKKKNSRKPMNYFYNWQQHTGSNPDKFYKTTLFQGEHMMVGLNCLEPGQTQSAHAHESADKFYFVLEGSGTFTVGNEERLAEAGTVVAAPAGIQHGVTNSGNERLSLLVAIAPPPIK